MLNKGMDVLYLHGWGVNKTVWQYISINAQNNSSTIIPCLYSLARQKNDCSFSAIAELLAKQLNNKTLVVAWSMGSLIATVLSQLTNKIQAMVFIAGAPCFVNRADWTNTIASKEFKKLEVLLNKDPAAAIQFFTGLIAHGDLSPKQTSRAINKNRVDVRDRDILASWLQEMKFIDQRSLYSSLSVPVLLLLGKNDVLINNDVITDLRRLNQGLQYEIIKDCGHAPFISKSAETEALIKNFILDVSS